MTTVRALVDVVTGRHRAPLTVRPLTRGDGAALWSFHRSQWRHVRRDDPQPWQAELARLTGVLPKLLRAGWCNVDGGFDDWGRLVAVLAWRACRGDLASAELLTVRHDCYGRGYGRQMLDHLMTTTRAAGVRQIVATVHQDNAAALRILEGVNATPRPDLGPVLSGYGAFVIECRGTLRRAGATVRG